MSVYGLPQVYSEFKVHLVPQLHLEVGIEGYQEFGRWSTREKGGGRGGAGEGRRGEEEIMLTSMAHVRTHYAHYSNRQHGM